MGDRSLLALSIDIHRFLEADRSTPGEERMVRDRAIGREIPATDDLQRVLNWWQRVGAAPDEAHSTGMRMVAVRRWIYLALGLAGLLVGGSACSVALSYDGAHPVNLLAFVGVMVGLPLVLLLLTILSVILRVARAGRSNSITAPNFNRWLIGLWQRLSGAAWQGPGMAGFGQSSARARFTHWQVLQFSQLFSVCFFVGAIVMFAILVAVTDLAFGWSTTLQLDAARVAAWVDVLAAPWAGWWSTAAPSAELVEASRFFRLQGALPAEQAVLLGEWWPFVLMTLLCWGLLPRLLMWGLCGWRLDRASRRMLREHSEVTALLDRMATPRLTLGEGGQGDTEMEQPADDIRLLATFGDAYRVIWNNAVSVAADLSLSGLQSDAALKAAITGIPAATPRLLLLVKAWEPPMLEVLDLLQLLAERVADSGSLVVVPVGLPEEEQHPATADLQIWSAAVARLKDPRIHVARLETLDGEAGDG